MEHLSRLKKVTDPLVLVEQLQEFQQYALERPAVIKAYHDLLLFYVAFPANKKILHLVTAELQRVAAAVGVIYQLKNITLQNSLTGSGIARSRLLCAYSFSLAKWLVKNFPGAVSLSGSDATPDEVVAVIQLLLPGIEFEKTSQRELTLSARIQAVAGIREPGAQLQWLIRILEESTLDDNVKDILYQQLKVFIQWKLDHPACSRTFLKIPVQKIWYQASLLKAINSIQLLREPVRSITTPAAERKILTDTVKASLAFYYRETDPFTYAAEKETVLFDLGRGMQIALTGMQTEKRLSLESYVGYMVFKNGVPLAYGGGWIWGQRCKIGVNIYPPFRKGESAWLFCQVLRTYYQYYGVRHFIVRPYQFGKSNPEGIRSGAFWFYYKLGFRPATADFKKLAEGEWEKIQPGHGYRTPENILKRFTASDLEWIIDDNSFPSFGADELSAAISKQVNTLHNGSGKKAVMAAGKKIEPQFSAHVNSVINGLPEKVKENFLLLCGFIPDLPRWNNAEKQLLARLWKLKSTGKERSFILQLQKHKRLWSSLENALCKP